MTGKTAVAQIDELLLAWDERLQRMDDNLVALEGEAVYQILAGKVGRRPALEGVTEERVGPALDAVTELFEHRARLGLVVDEAKRVRASISALTFWESDDKMAEILRLLRGASIDLGREAVALGERSLLDQGYREVIVDAEELLARMVGRFDEAREALLAVSRAWRSLGVELSQIEAEIASLRVLAAELAPRAAHDKTIDIEAIERLEADLATLRARVTRDPLGVDGSLRDTIAPRLAALASTLGAAAEARRRALAALDEARAEKARLDADHARAIALFERARHDLEGESVRRLPRPLDEGLVAGLAGWLAKLEGTTLAARWSPAEVGLARFADAIARERAAESAAIARIEELLGRPAELLGRLSARRAQAAALAARGLALPDRAEGEARRAEALLRRRPTPIDEAARAVEAFEALVVGLSARP